MAGKDISVVIVSWNAREFLRGCLQSIREHGGQVVREVVVVDNASADESAEMVSQLFPEVRLIRSADNLGFARGNNLGIQHASGEFVALINSDVVLHPDCLERLANALDEDRQIGLVAPRILGGDGQLQHTCRRLPTVWNLTCELLALDKIFRWRPFAGRDMQPLGTEEQTQVEILSGCFWMARRSAIEKVGGLDERFFFYAEDVDWCKRFREAGWKVVYVAKASATHFGGASSANAPLRYSIELLRANRNYWKKHHGLGGQAAFCALAILHHAGRFLIRGTQTLFKRDLDPAGAAYKCRRSLVCLRWLLTGKGV